MAKERNEKGKSAIPRDSAGSEAVSHIGEFGDACSAKLEAEIIDALSPSAPTGTLDLHCNHRVWLEAEKLEPHGGDLKRLFVGLRINVKLASLESAKLIRKTSDGWIKS